MSLKLSSRAARRELPRAAANAHTQWLARDTRIITLKGDDGQHGSGEVAPLPGFSPDTLGACQEALAALDLSGLPDHLESGQSVLVELERASERLPRALPAARAGLEAALLDLWARAAGVPAWALLTSTSAPPRPRAVAALLMGEPEQLLEQALAARARGVSAFKLKVGRRGAIERELGALSDLRAQLGPSVELRLDANRAWSLVEARTYLPRFALAGPALVEEPCSLADLPGLAPSAVPLGLDESLSDLQPDSATAAQLGAWGVHQLILKPTVLGGISSCTRWARVAHQCGAEVIISHAFEGPLGLLLGATLALGTGSERAAHGLDLEGARLSGELSSVFVGAQIQPWSTPGFGSWQVEP